MPISSDQRWRSCLDQLGPRLLLYARQWVAEPADAEDVVQSAFIRFWKKHPAATESEWPLLYASVRCAALDLLRRENRRARREESFAANPSPAAENLFVSTGEQQEEADLISARLNDLPPAQREAIVLRIWGDLTFQQIATIVGVSINTVAARYRYGLAAMRRSLQTSDYDRIRT